MTGWKRKAIGNDETVETSAPMMEYSHCDSYFVNRTKFTYWSVRDGLTDTLLVNVIVFLVSFTFNSARTYYRSRRGGGWRYRISHSAAVERSAFHQLSGTISDYWTQQGSKSDKMIRPPVLSVLAVTSLLPLLLQCSRVVCKVGFSYEFRGVATALKPVRAEQVRRPEWSQVPGPN